MEAESICDIAGYKEEKKERPQQEACEETGYIAGTGAAPIESFVFEVGDSFRYIKACLQKGKELPPGEVRQNEQVRIRYEYKSEDHANNIEIYHGVYEITVIGDDPRKIDLG
ncbi:hypothetical protein GF351_04905 [Candidatus Woesearchaeota archaeon]|nr:hypothetical protein [Candidatus Woesearchaeota archaeon]